MEVMFIEIPVIGFFYEVKHVSFFKADSGFIRAVFRDPKRKSRLQPVPAVADEKPHRFPGLDFHFLMEPIPCIFA